MANDSFLGRPLLLVAVHPEQVDKPIEIALEVGRFHARETAGIAPDPRAEVVDERHVRQALRAGCVGLVAFAH